MLEKIYYWLSINSAIIGDIKNYSTVGKDCIYILIYQIREQIATVEMRYENIKKKS